MIGKVSEKTLLAAFSAVLVAIAAHASGKPWWVDRPFAGDCVDIALMWFIVVRIIVGCFDADEDRP